MMCWRGCGGAETVGSERKECAIVLHQTIRHERPRWLTRAAGIAFGLALLGTPGLPAAMAQNEGVTVGGGASLGEAPSASDIEAIVNSILADVFGEGVGADDGVTTGGDFNVGGNMGGSVTTGGGMGGGISIGGGGSGSIAVE